jgi:23S rRNA pseudouridine1911/1915/1917 synthase
MYPPRMAKIIQHETIIPEDLAGLRLDQALAKLFPQYSRSRLKTWLDNKKIKVNDEYWQPKNKVSGNEKIIIEAKLEEETKHCAESIKLEIIYEDDDIIIVNKPPGMVVHPAIGNRNNTLLNALLHHSPQLKELPRAGIVHRLDKDTSGLLMIAKTLEAHTNLVKQLQDRKILREYKTIVQGSLISGNTIDAPIGRHPRQRIKMAVVDMPNKGKPAITHYRIIERFQNYTYIKVKLETGRTHQIRVHMAHIHHPIVGDQAYGGRLKLPKGASAELIDALQQFKRQALHAYKLGLKHPLTGEFMSWEADIPEDMKILLSIISH